ncbi:MAG: hypothetical protein ABJ084_02600 [Halioglobus sp.]
MIYTLLRLTVPFVLCFVGFISSLAAEPTEDTSLATADLSEIDRKLNNPLTSIWSLTFQNNSSANTGDAVSGTEYSNTLFFQPFLPFEVGADKETMFTLRPVFPVVTQPEIDLSTGKSSSHMTGYGDTQLLTLAGPNSGEGFVLGGGASFIFPTASDDILGQGKYQVGPALMAFNIGKPWVYGVLAQHWNSVGGDSDRPDTSRTDVQYTIRYSLPNAMSIGLGPTISYDWEADSDNALTFPIGLGLTKTTRWGKTPVKLRAELHYSVVKPDDYGTEWNFRFQVTPVINNPFK